VSVSRPGSGDLHGSRPASPPGGPEEKDPSQSDTGDVFIARQPILDAGQRIFGYELLFRSGAANVYDSSDPTEATSRLVASAISVHGLDTLTLGAQAFINVTRDILLAGTVLVLPSHRTVLEILETLTPDHDVIEACKALKRRGYRIALDDFVDDDRHRPFVALADMIKVDVLATTPDDQRALIKRIGRPGLAFVAEKVETPTAFADARAAGYKYFQGYFFSRPVLVGARDVPSAKMNYLRLLAELNQPAHTLWGLEEIIKRDVGLSYKLLRYVNSAFFGRARRIESLIDALLLVGEDKIKAWASVMALSAMASDRPAALQAMAVTRGNFCERLAAASPVSISAADAFLVGLFSLLDAMVGRPLPDILRELSLTSEVTETLLGEETPLRPVYELAVAHERADWDVMGTRTVALGIPQGKSSVLYRDAITWAHETCSQLSR